MLRGSIGIEPVRENDDIAKQKSGRGCEFKSLRSRIIDMKRRAVQLSKSRREPARRAKDKRESVDWRTHGVREVLRPELGKIETLKSFLLLFLFEEVNSWYPRNEPSQPGGQSLARDIHNPS